MSDQIADPSFTWLSARVRQVADLSARHPLVIDLVIAAATVVASVVALVSQHHFDGYTVSFSLALSVPLLLRRVSAFLCFAVIALVALAQWLITGPLLADAALLIALYWVARDDDFMRGAVAAGTLELGAIMAAVRWSPSDPLKMWVGLSGLGTAAGVLGVTIRQRRALLASLHERAARLEFERDQEGRLGAAAERARIAREMHDIVAHNLSVMIALADGASYAMDTSPARAAEATARVSATGRDALVEMRRLLGVLRDDPAEDSLEPQPSLGQLDKLIERVHAAGIPVTVEIHGDPRQLTQGVQLTVFRVAQEALTNTLKHAQRPTSAHLALRCKSGQVELEVTDTGERQLDAGSGGRGLPGMRERAAAYGGLLDAGPRQQGGWRVHLRLQPDAQALAPDAQPLAPDAQALAADAQPLAPDAQALAPDAQPLAPDAQALAR